MQSVYQLKLFGYNDDFKDLINIYNNNKMPNKLLLSGSKGIGKSTFAYHLINYILSKNEDYNYDNKLYIIDDKNRSFKLLSSNTHPNFYLIDKNIDKKFIEISQIREMNSFVNKSSLNNKDKIVLIDGVENLSISASNSLLKVLEEPNTNVQFILIYDTSKNLLDTIKSRCIEFKMNLKIKYFIDIINSLYDNNYYDAIHSDLKIFKISPYYLVSIINLCIENKISINNCNIEFLLKFIIDNKLYKKKINIDLLKVIIELFFYKKVLTLKNGSIFKIIDIYKKKFSDIIKFNLDLEPFFIELKSEFLNEK